MQAGVYSQADIIGKKASVVYDLTIGEIKEYCVKEEYMFVNDVKLDRALMSTAIKITSSITDLLDEMEQGSPAVSYFQQGAKIFSADKYNFIKNGSTIGSELQAYYEL
ncbi:hypothetical protein PGRAN_15802 [Listeria grandensis FSL F6-0971]|uniref:Uncharacterized protein n=1 Tax=Listeria grandensis FSL F6-0971 TaxID=1265819 RepID=W7AZ75_9LIST|nr:hypothetical protein [Listeria grandensis]EUJ18540.1 hypothetical protein PGRAN_15802 [Listeria grandensis FSL F6-0971]